MHRLAAAAVLASALFVSGCCACDELRQGAKDLGPAFEDWRSFTVPHPDYNDAQAAEVDEKGDKIQTALDAMGAAASE